MFKGNAAVLKGLEHLAAKANFRIHHVFFNIDGTEAPLSCNSRNDEFGFLAGAFHNPCPVIVRRIGIADIDGNPFLSYRENSVLMENRCPHIGKLPQLLIGDGIDAYGVGDDTGIRNQETRNISPVFINLRMNSLCHDGSCNIGTSPGKSMDSTVRHSAVKTGNYRILFFFQSCGHHLIRFVRIKIPVLVKENHFRRINKSKFQIGRHDDAVQIFSSGSCIILSRFFLKII